VIGVVLSGELTDGTAGLRAIKECGGIAIVEEPDAAAFPAMARNALRHVKVDHIVTAHALGGLIVRLTREPPGATPLIPVAIRLETAIAAQELPGIDIENTLGKPSRFACPECHDALWEIDDTILRGDCRHAAELATGMQTLDVERMLWRLMRRHRERAALARRMARQATDQCRASAAEMLRERAAGCDEDAEIIRGLLREYAAAGEGDLARETS
jgi:two-component system chemotaxis response regulator CheB